MKEVPLLLPCRNDRLVGVVHTVDDDCRLGLVVVVGGPQYRVGSHRQFVLLARRLAAAGTPVLRFDYRGMGDSEGQPPGFEAIEDDICVAVDTLLAHQPFLTGVVLWGLCDGATASALYASKDPRIAGLVLLNPYVHTEEGTAQAFLKHYYLARLNSADFWRKILQGRFRLGASLKSLAEKLSVALGGRRSVAVEQGDEPLPQRMAAALERFEGRMLFILSGNDLVGAAFGDLMEKEERWRRLTAAPQVHCRRLTAANHTFARRLWREQVEKWTLDWLESFRS